MSTIFLIIIYLSFISLGLPDSILGSAWPAMSEHLNVSIESAGLISIIVSFGTVVSSLLSGFLLKKYKTGSIVFVSILMTAISLLGFSYFDSYIYLVFMAIPLGLGAGTIDAALNNYVAIHYKAYHMNFLHAFWGVGVTVSPLIMAQFLLKDTYKTGYLTIAIIQFILSISVLFSLPMWKKNESNSKNEKDESSDADHKIISKKNIFKIKGVKFQLFTFMFYCGLESTFGLWSATYMVKILNLSESTASIFVSFYYGGIMIGRFLSGFLSLKFKGNQLIKSGISIIMIAIILFTFVPYNEILFKIIFLLIGLGCAPIYPALVHNTPKRFGKENSSVIIGFQMAFAYIGTTLLSPLFGVIASKTSFKILPIFLFIYCFGILINYILINFNNKNKNS